MNFVPDGKELFVLKSTYGINPEILFEQFGYLPDLDSRIKRIEEVQRRIDLVLFPLKNTGRSLAFSNLMDLTVRSAKDPGVESTLGETLLGWCEAAE